MCRHSRLKPRWTRSTAGSWESWFATVASLSTSWPSARASREQLPTHASTAFRDPG